MADENTPNFSADDLAFLSGGADPDAGKDAGKEGAKDTPPGDAGAKTGASGAGEGAGGQKDGGDGKETPKVSWPSEGFPEDWRDRTVKMLNLEGDALKKAQEAAKRSASPAELLRRVMGADAKIGEVTAELKGRVKIPVGAGVKAEDAAAFDKAWGVPEAPDKYDLAALGDLNPVDREVWETVLPGFHKGHFSQAQIGEVGKALKTAETIVAKRMEERATKIDQETEDMLRIEYPGKEYGTNVELANRYLEELLGKHMPEKGERTSFLNMRLEDGTRIGSYPPFVKAVVEAARAWAPDGLPEVGEDSGGIDPAKRIAEITALSHSPKEADKAEYQRLQPELLRLMTAQNKRAAAGR